MREYIHGVTVENMRVSGKKIRWKEKVSLLGLTVGSTRASIKMTLRRDLESLNGKMGENM